MIGAYAHGIQSSIYPLSTWERLISPPTMGRSLIDIHMDTFIHPFFYLLACSAAGADGRMMTTLLPMHPFHVAGPNDPVKESTLTQSSFPPSITHLLPLSHPTTNIQSNRYPHAAYHLNNKQYADLRKSTPSPMLCLWSLTNQVKT